MLVKKERRKKEQKGRIKFLGLHLLLVLPLFRFILFHLNSTPTLYSIFLFLLAGEVSGRVALEQRANTNTNSPGTHTPYAVVIKEKLYYIYDTFEYIFSYKFLFFFWPFLSVVVRGAGGECWHIFAAPHFLSCPQHVRCFI